MKQVIKIFLASSNELEHDRDVLGNLVRRLNKIYEKRGLSIDLFEWEDSDAAFNNRRKQDEYNDEVRASDMFIALFYKKAGKYTVEEFEVATEEFKRTEVKPKSYVFCRDLSDGETESTELKEFKRHLVEEIGQYWSRYGNKDSLCLHFVLQLQMVESGRIHDVEVDNGIVHFEGEPLARMDRLTFASDNADFRRMSRRITELPQLIDKARLRANKYPEDGDLQDDLQRLLNEKKKLQDDFDQHQSLLLDTAKKISRLQENRITERMQRAIDAFERGNVHEANVILDEAERDADCNLEDFQRSKEFTEQKRQTVIHSIEELLLKISTIMADGSLVLEERVDRTDELYAKADRMASAVEYDPKKHADFLSEYSFFLNTYGRYDKSLAIGLRIIPLYENNFGEEDTAELYNNIGVTYISKGDYPSALDFLNKALMIVEKTLWKEHPFYIGPYINIGEVYLLLGDYARALDYNKRALSICENVYGEENSAMATAYNNIGVIYDEMGDYSHAIEYYKKAHNVCKKIFGLDHPSTATSYNNIGSVLHEMGDYSHALDYFKHSVSITKRVLGDKHPWTATCYNQIGMLYLDMGDYTKALEHCKKALTIREDVFGSKHPDTATSYNNIGLILFKMGCFTPAMEYYRKALEIRETVLGKEHTSTATTLYNIGMACFAERNFKDAKKYLNKALTIKEKALGDNHPQTQKLKEEIAMILHLMP